MLSLETNLVAEVRFLIANTIFETSRVIPEMTKEQCFAVLSDMRKRVHQDGNDANGSRIGTYSPAYMKVRTGSYSNSKKRDSGTFTKGSKKGQARPKYNRTNDKRVILSLTRTMEKDYVVISIPNGHAIAFTNPMNKNKAVWNEKRYKKPIFAVSDSEMKSINEITDFYINKLTL